MRQSRIQKTGLLLVLYLLVLLPAATASAIPISVAAPIETQTLPTLPPQEEFPVVARPESEISLAWENPEMSYGWHKDQAGNYTMFPSSVCAPITLWNRTACADANVTVSCSAPPESDLSTFFGGPDRVSIGISATPDGPVSSELTFSAVSGACAETGQTESTLVFYYRIVPDADIQLPPERIDSVQNNRLQSAVSFTITAVTPHQHKEEGNMP